MLGNLFTGLVPVTELLRPSDFVARDWLWRALPFLTFVLGVGVGAALMYVPMTLRLWKLQRRLAKVQED
jgi:hypothetical protein